MSEWPSMNDIDELPEDILRRWFWQPIAAVTKEQQATVRRAASRLFSPPKIAPVYLPAPEPKTEAEKWSPKPSQKPQLSPKPKPEVPAAQESSLDIFNSLFRKP